LRDRGRCRTIVAMGTRQLLPAAAGFALAAAAQPAPVEQSNVQARYSADYTECIADSMATPDVIFCTQVEDRQQQARLQSAFRKALERLPARRKAPFRTAQAMWLTGAGARCDKAVADEPFESVKTAKRGQCMLDETIRRTIELERRR
jgi:uncharacterized protein YecT (DUF1311 family)